MYSYSIQRDIKVNFNMHHTVSLYLQIFVIPEVRDTSNYSNLLTMLQPIRHKKEIPYQYKRGREKENDQGPIH